MAALAEVNTQPYEDSASSEELPPPLKPLDSNDDLIINVAHIGDAGPIRDIIRRGMLDTLRDAGVDEGQAYSIATGLYGEKERQNLRIIQKRIESENYDARVIDQLVFVARKGREIKGCVWPHLGKDRTQWLGSLYVRADSRGEGVGSALIAQTLELFDYKATSLVVAEANEGAQRLYKRFGFKVVGKMTATDQDKDFALPLPKLLMTRPAGTPDLLHYQ